MQTQPFFKIGIVEDDPFFMRALGQQLNALQINCWNKGIILDYSVFFSGKRLDLENVKEYDLFLLDYFLDTKEGDITGGEVLRRIKEKSPDSKVIFLTMMDYELEMEKLMDLGAHMILHKSKQGMDYLPKLIQDEITRQIHTPD